jgi:hypothetical protein
MVKLFWYVSTVFGDTEGIDGESKQLYMMLMCWSVAELPHHARAPSCRRPVPCLGKASVFAHAMEREKQTTAFPLRLC